MKTVIAEHYSYHHQNLIAAVKEKKAIHRIGKAGNYVYNGAGMAKTFS